MATRAHRRSAHTTTLHSSSHYSRSSFRLRLLHADPDVSSNPLGVSALAGPNIRLQSDRAGSARSLSPRPPSSGIFSERTQTRLTALLFAHHVRHVCMSSDGAQRKTRLRSRSFSFVKIIMFEVVSCAMRASRTNHSEYSFRSSSWWKDCCFPTRMHHARSRASTCSRAALVDSSYVILLIIGKKSAASPRVAGDRATPFERAVLPCCQPY